jgi:hypothetical protein
MGLDRFRIQSIIGVLNSKILSPAQAALAQTELVKKAVIVANGYKKRGNREEYERYSGIAETFSNRS